MSLIKRRNKILQEAAQKGVGAARDNIVHLAEDAATVCSANKGFLARVRTILSSSKGRPDNYALIALLKDSGDALDE